MSNTDPLNRQIDQLLYRIEADEQQVRTFMDSLKEKNSIEAVEQKTQLRAMREQLIDTFANLGYSSEPTDSRIAKHSETKPNKL